MAFLCTWACDSAAYLVGSAIGRHPFSPRISPKKTWEGHDRRRRWPRR